MLVMMTGELEFDNLKYPQHQFLDKSGNLTSIESRRQLNHFPYLAHALVMVFVVMVNIVMMSLLVALAIRDMAALSKTAQRRELEDQFILIDHVEKSFSSKLFMSCPNCFKAFLGNWVLIGGSKFDMNPDVNYLKKDNAIHSNHFKLSLKQFCENKKANESANNSKEELKHLKNELFDLKTLLAKQLKHSS